MTNGLSKKVTFFSLVAFTAPTIFMMMFMSLYTMVDGIFVSRVIGTTALSAVNIVYPVISLVIALGVMLATGGSAVVAMQMGEGKADEARRNFSLIVVTGIVCGVIFSLAGFLFLNPLLKLLGANETVYGYCRDYLFFLLPTVPFAILQMLFQCFFVTAGKPLIGLAVTIVGGFANIALDYLFMVPLNMGISGAAIATGIGFAIPALFGLIYFSVCRKNTLYLTRPKMKARIILQTCANGSSEMVSNLSTAVTTLLFNITMMRLLGENGVAAITIVLYAQYVLTAAFLGYSTGVAPLFSFNHGTRDHDQLKKLFKISMMFILLASILVFFCALIFAPLITTVFARSGTSVYDIAIHGFYLFAAAYLFMGMNIFASAMFTAFSNGRVSAIISFLRTFVFIIAAILILPRFIGVAGVWIAVPLAELLNFFISAGYFYKLRKTYHYW